MAIASVQSGRNFDAWGGTTTIAVSLTGITAGNLLVAFLSWEGGDATVSSVSDGTSNLTAGTKYNHSNNDQYQQAFYLLSANSGNKTITATMTSGKNIRTLHVVEFNLQSGQLDTQAGTYGSGSPFSSGNFSTSGSDVICIAHAKTYTQGTFSAWDIAGTSGVSYVSGLEEPGYEGETWWRNTTVSADNAQVAFTGGSAYVCSVIAFKAASAASGNPWYYYAQQLRSLKDKWRGLLTIPSLEEVKLYGRARYA